MSGLADELGLPISSQVGKLAPTAFTPKPLYGSGADERKDRRDENRTEPAPTVERRKPIPRRIRFRIMREANFKCVYCGVPGGVVREDGSVAVLDIDHKLARSAGGSDEYDNLCCACELCNNGKRAGPAYDPEAAAKEQWRRKKDAEAERVIEAGRRNKPGQ